MLKDKLTRLESAVKRALCDAENRRERKCAEEALQSANAYTRTLVEASLDPLVTIGADGKIMDVNEAA